MQTFKIDINENIVDKIVWFLNNFDGVKVEKFDNNSNINILKNSVSNEKEEVLNGRFTKIDDIDECKN